MEPPPNPYNYSPPQHPYPPPSFPSQQAYAPQQPYPSSPPQPMPGFSYTQAQARPTGRIAFTRGLLFGLLLILLVAVWIIVVSTPSPLQSALNNASSADPFGIANFFVNLLISLVQGVIAWVIYYFAGRAGARAGGKVSTGLIACLWASLWYLLADLIGFFVLAAITAASLHDPSYVLDSLPTIQQTFAIDAVLALIGLAFGAAGANKGAPRPYR